jgi:hypothetical protein
MRLWPKTREELDAIVNRQFDTPEYKQYFAVKLTPEREKLLNLHYPHYIKSRRDCWAAASVKAPLDVKRAIWEHEKDELIYDQRMGSAHLTDAHMAEATAETNLLPGARAAMYAWMYLRRLYTALRSQKSRRSGRYGRDARRQHESAHGGGRGSHRHVRADL